MRKRIIRRAAQGPPCSVNGWSIVTNRRVIFTPFPSAAASSRLWVLAVTLIYAPAINAAGQQASSSHWAYLPMTHPAPPSVKQESLVRTNLDRFIQHALEARKLSIGPEADRHTLIRRVSLDLTGLPPSPEELETFLADSSNAAYEKMVDRYLASPHYGVRWGKYWLDAAGYADSNGYFHADSDRPIAYRYRDYVIQALNVDKPYDQFVTEQLAGDELVGYVLGGDVTPDIIEPLIATHFLRNAPDGTGESDGNPQERQRDRYAVIESTLQITMSSLMGITIQCARCHAHKFEPIQHDEYYELQAIFTGGYTPSPDHWRKPNERVVQVGTVAERTEHARTTSRIDQQLKTLRETLESVAAPARKQLIEIRLAGLDADQRAKVIEAWTKSEKERSDEQKALLKTHEKAIQISDEDLANTFGEYAGVRDHLKTAINDLEKQRPAPLMEIACLAETDVDPPPHHLLIRGVHEQPGDPVQPGVPAALCASTHPYTTMAKTTQSEHPKTTGRRLAFARWLTAPDHPLFARVMANRIWQHHFGAGIVRTPDNFGMSGSPPTHPELLDHLATEFANAAFSIKAMHRLILRSAVYRQTGEIHPAAQQIDPDNTLLWRYPVRRLDAEAIRDAMLDVAGELDERFEGPYVPTNREGDGAVVVDENRDGAKRRSIYLQQRRTQTLTMLELFDSPSIVTNCTERVRSTVPLQSLELLNSRFSVARADAFAARVQHQAGQDTDARILRAFLLAYARAPSPAERTAALDFLQTQKKLYESTETPDQAAWRDLCQMILAANAFLYVN
jgi:hypothetical protein